MPIEIRELVIRTEIDEQSVSSASPRTIDEEAMIAECVRRVLQQLQEEDQR